MRDTTTELTNAEDVTTLLTNGVLAKPITYGQDDTVKAAVALVPDGYRLDHLPVEQVQERPTAKRAERTLHDTESFIDYVAAHVTPATTVFVDPPSGYSTTGYATATIDDHGKDEAGWGDHTAALELPRSESLAAWVGQNERYVNQFEFAEFLEANAADVVNPDAATLLEVVTSLQSTNKVSFDSAVRLDNGQVQVRYSEEVSATAGKSGSLEIPQEFTIAVPVFEYGPRYAIKARLRYRVKDQKLVLAYTLQRVTDIVRDALVTGENSVMNTLRAGLPDVPVYLGTTGDKARHGTLAGIVKGDD